MRFLHQLEENLNTYFGDKAPVLPPNVKDFITKITPWVNVVLFVLALPAVLAIFSIGTLLSPLALVDSSYNGTLYFISLLALLGTEVLWAMAIPGLFKFTRRGWRLLFYGELLNISYSIFGALAYFAEPSMMITKLLWTAIFSAISLYFLFQIRDRFNR